MFCNELATALRAMHEVLDKLKKEGLTLSKEQFEKTIAEYSIKHLQDLFDKNKNLKSELEQ